MWIATWTPAAWATVRQASMAAGVEPQSSCSLKPAAPARSCSHRPAALTVLPLPSSTMLTGHWVVAASIMSSQNAPGVTVVALVPSAGPVPPPISVVIPAASATGICCGAIRCTWLSMPPAVRISPLPASTSVDGPMTSAGVDPVHGVRVAGLAERDDPAVPDADIGLDHAPVVEHDGAGDDQVGSALGAGGQALAHRLADHLAAAEDRLLAGQRPGAAAAVLGHLDQQVGVGQPDPVPGRRPVQRGVPLPRYISHCAAPGPRACRPARPG